MIEYFILAYLAVIHFHITYRSNCGFSQCMMDVEKEEDINLPELI